MKEEKEQLEANIQAALSSGSINLEDAIDIRQINNLKLANQMIKLKRKKAAEAAQAAQASKYTSSRHKLMHKLVKLQQCQKFKKQQAVLDTKLKFEKGKSGYEIERMRVESQIKRELMELEFNYNMQLGEQKIIKESQREADIEERKDKRARIVGTQQSAMIDQKKNDLLPIDFETNNEGGLEI